MAAAAVPAVPAPTRRVYFDEPALCVLGGVRVVAVHPVHPAADAPPPPPAASAGAGPSDGDGAGATVGVVFDATLFYAQGGGQPSDAGTIAPDDEAADAATGAASSGTMSVVRLSVDRDSDTVVHHMRADEWERAGLAVGDRVRMRIDGAKRQLHARLHSAGHLLDCAMQRLGCKNTPTKGNHFPDSPYVEYAGDLSSRGDESVESTVAALNAELARLISTDEPVVVQTVARADVASICGFDPAYLSQSVPTVRIVTIGGNPSPCGGTHIARLGELGGVHVHKIKVTNKKGDKTTRISYSVAA